MGEGGRQQGGGQHVNGRQTRGCRGSAKECIVSLTTAGAGRYIGAQLGCPASGRRSVQQSRQHTPARPTAPNPAMRRVAHMSMPMASSERVDSSRPFFIRGATSRHVGGRARSAALQVGERRRAK